MRRGDDRDRDRDLHAPTGKLKYKEVAIALALMEAKLNLASGTAATPIQIKTALAGAPDGILTMRAAKKNWVQIARSLGLFAHTAHVSAKDDDDDDDD